MEIVNYLVSSIPLIVALVIWAVHLEKKITRIETDISWLKMELPKCQPNSEDPTH